MIDIEFQASLFVSQVALSGTQIWWTTEVNIAFARLEEGYENALKDYYKKQVRFPNQDLSLQWNISIRTLHAEEISVLRTPFLVPNYALLYN